MKSRTNGDIVITRQELDAIKEDIKDEVKFRTKVLVELRLLSNLPPKVTRLEVWVAVLWVIVSGIMFMVLKGGVLYGQH